VPKCRKIAHPFNARRTSRRTAPKLRGNPAGVRHKRAGFRPFPWRDGDRERPAMIFGSSAGGYRQSPSTA
jgi:hypothetical protein